jgi:hypothetical protein
MPPGPATCVIGQRKADFVVAIRKYLRENPNRSDNAATAFSTTRFSPLPSPAMERRETAEVNERELNKPVRWRSAQRSNFTKLPCLNAASLVCGTRTPKET